MKRPNKLKSKKYYIPALVILFIFIYLVFAYNYFYFRLHRVKISWPDNSHVYSFNAGSGHTKTYVALGDSLTYGFGADSYSQSWTYKTAEYLAGSGQGITLKDFSYPGYRVEDVLESIGPAIAAQPDIVTLFVGVNDTHRFIQTGEFGQKYEYVLSRLSSETKAKIYVVNLPYLGGPTVLLPPYNYYFDAQTKARNKTIKELASRYGAAYIDLYGSTSAMFKKSGPYYAKDLYHPSSEGYAIWAKIIDDAIRN